MTDRRKVATLALWAADGVAYGACHIHGDLEGLQVESPIIFGRFKSTERAEELANQVIRVYRQTGGERNEPLREITEWAGTAEEARRSFR